MSETTKHTKHTKRELPAGWRWVRLGEVIQEAQAGFACGERDAEGIAQLRMNNVDTRGNFVWDEVIRVPREGNNIEPFLLVPGDVLFNNTNSTELVGKSALFTGYTEPIVYSNHFTRLRTVSDALLPDVLASWLNHQWQQGVFAAICNKWIGQSAVKADKLLNLEIPLPPLDEQEGREEQEAEALGLAFTPSLVAPYRWCDWGAPTEETMKYTNHAKETMERTRDDSFRVFGVFRGWKRQELQSAAMGSFFNFVNTELLPHLKELKNQPGATPRQKVISEIMTGVERVRIDTERNFLGLWTKSTNRARYVYLRLLGFER